MEMKAADDRRQELKSMADLDKDTAAVLQDRAGTVRRG